MGYGNPSQSGTGIHMRLFARAFVVASDSAPQRRVAYVTIEAAMLFHETKARAMQLLAQRFGSLYNHNNTMISATHTHSGPGGFTYFALYDITTLGFQRESLEVVAHGIAEAVARAHTNLRSASIRLASGDLNAPQTNINRSPSAYLANPKAERDRYAFNVDKRFTLLRFDDSKKVCFVVLRV
jgi:neutral ceramidase